MRSYDYLEMYKEKNNLRSDYMVAGALHISRQAMSNYKNGRPLDEELAMRVADSIGVKQSEIFAVIAAERCRTPAARKALMRLAELSKQSGRATANLLILNSFISFVGVIFYILCKIRHDRKPLSGDVNIHTQLCFK